MLTLTPTEVQHRAWTTFAATHAPCLHADQTKSSRIESFLYFWAAKHEFMHPSEKVRIRITEAPFHFYMTAADLAKVPGVEVYLAKASAQFPWVESLCCRHLTMWLAYMDGNGGLDENIPDHLQDVFVMDALRDCLLDHDSAVDMFSTIAIAQPCCESGM